jgi:uncharacterized protein YhfF
MFLTTNWIALPYEILSHIQQMLLTSEGDDVAQWRKKHDLFWQNVLQLQTDETVRLINSRLVI